MDNTKIKSFSNIVPMIYAYTTPGVPAHDGWTKIGYTAKQSVKDRIWQQTHTVDVQPHLEWSSEARYTDGSGAYFTDHEFHDYLTVAKHVERRPQTEWFHIDGKTSKNYFYHFRDRDASDVQDSAAHTPYVLRAEQQRAVEQTAAYYAAHKDDYTDDARSFLWNAKPRFGKTLTTYDFARCIDAARVLIVTNRPSIANSWYQDFAQFIRWQTGYLFVSETDALADQPVLSYAAYQDHIDKLADDEIDRAGLIAFESLQGLKGSIYFGGNYKKLKWIAETDWDLLVIDEAHEGVDTYKTDKAFDNIKRKFTLHLSGTPFKAIASSKFRPEQIFNWSYEDEQEAKATWKATQGTNPYEKLPRLNMFTYQLSNMIRDTLAKGLDLSEDEHAEYAFDLNEFFRVDKGRFVYEKDVEKFLDTLTTNEKFPFSTPELRNELRHTFWLFNRVDSVKAMAKLLKKHPVFEHYEVVIAAGDGKLDAEDDSENKKSYDKVIDAIAHHDRTITLSVGQLTTGVTVKPWTAVFILSNMKSPAEYMQAAFRAQNPYEYEDKEDGKLYQKENAYVFDFAPERTLMIFDDFANNLNATTANGGGTKAEHEEHIKRLLNFFPVIAEDDEGKMVELDAAKVLTIPKTIKAKEVIRRGFMSNFLFQNIGNIFSAPAAVRSVLEKLTPAEEQADKKNDLSMKDAEFVSVDEDGEVDVPQDIVVQKSSELFGKKIYEDVTRETQGLIDDAAKSETPSPLAEVADAVAETLVQNLQPTIDTDIKDAYGLTKGKAKQISTRIEKDIKETFQHLADDHEQAKKIILADHEEKVQQATSEAEVQKLNEDVKTRIQQATEAFQKDLQETAEKKLAETQQHVVEELERAQETQKKEGVEEDIRAHLRGFARTIPSFIMAYSEMAHGGGKDLRLANFDDYTPDDVFAEVTGITEPEFRFLRDGGPYDDPETGETKHFEGHLFNEVVFDESIQEFLRLKERLADYFDETQDEDIFDYIPPQKTNQIFTPKNVVTQMVDALEAENPGIFDDPEKTFVDFYMKSGLYITEIVKRLYKSDGLKAAYPDDAARLRHILEHQVYGFAPSHIIYSIAIAYIFGFDKAAQNISQRNFVDLDVMEYVKHGKLDEVVQEQFGDNQI
ncbi:MAG: DEAD/DEAH box helicase family protein [Selenomonas sp.]